MSAQTLAAPLIGALMLAAAPAAAQTPPDDHASHGGHADHGSHPATTPSPEAPPPDETHADGHHQEMPTAAPTDHGGHDHDAMTGALGPYPMAREASGTAWQPDTSTGHGRHDRVGDWTLMSHALINLVHSSQSGPRGDDQTFVAGMVMGSARRDFANGSTLNLRAMLSPDPFMGEEGYPLLLAAGETSDGVNPLIDRQHPHELVMELSASYAWRMGDEASAFVYLGLPGEPAFGPPAFMHRQSAMDSPEAPITHHWLDSTHIVFGVVTAGVTWRDLRLETSAFRGREPDQDRYDIEAPELDSWSVRASWNPTQQWSLQLSYADVTSPEQLEPDEDETRWSASAIHTVPIGSDGWWSHTLAWGRKTDEHDDSRDAWLLETAVAPNRDWTLFARAERIETNELVPAAGGGHGDLYTVGKVSVGMVRDWHLSERVSLGLGGLYAFNRVPDELETLYGGDPEGSMVFLRLRIR